MASVADPSACRYCSTKCKRYISSDYLHKGRKEIYSEMFSETFNIIVLTETETTEYECKKEISHLICIKCISKLRDATEFKKRVLECEIALQQYLQDTCKSLNTGLDMIVYEAGPMKTEQLLEESAADDADVEYLEDMDFEDAHDQLEGIAIIQKEEPIIEEPAPKARKRKNTRNVKLKGTQRKKAKIKNSLKTINEAAINNTTEDVEDEASQNVAGDELLIMKVEAESLERVSTPHSDTTYCDEHALGGDASRQSAIALLRHTTACPFQPAKIAFRCCFCPRDAPAPTDPAAFRLHVDSAHASQDRATCLKHRNESMTRVDITDLRCRYDCLDTFQSLEDAARHLVEVHNHDLDLNQGVGLVPIRLESDRFACVICSKTYSTLHQLSRHTGSHFCRNICYKCGCNFETLKGLKKHVIFSHSKHKHLCQKCKQPFQDLAAKRAHLRANKTCRSFKCKFCKERFLCLETQQEHLAKEHGKPKVTYPCPECGEVFEKRIRRYLHFKVTHTDDFKCSYCGVKFSNNRCLQDHIARVHTFERKYRCAACDKAFIDARTLRTHSFIHDVSKKQACPACDRAFTMKVRLKYHVQKYHPDILSEVFPMAAISQ